MAAFPTAEWFARYKDAINDSDVHRELGETWEGDVTYVVQDAPGLGDVWAWMDLHHGECRDVKLVTPEEGTKARFVIKAPFERWMAVVNGEIDPLKAMMRGELVVTGDLPAILRYKAATLELVRLARTVTS